MKIFGGARFVLLVGGAVAAGLLVSPVEAATPAEDAVLAPIQAMFDGMAKRDATAIKEQALPGGTVLSFRNGVPTQITIEAFAERSGMPGATHNQERIHDPVVRIDNDLAVVWAQFEYLIDGKVSSCGTDLFNLVRKDGRWLVANLMYTGRRDCAAK